MNNNIEVINYALNKKISWNKYLNYHSFENNIDLSNPPKILNLFLQIFLNTPENIQTFVLPANKNISYMASILFSLEAVKSQYAKYLKDFEKYFVPGGNVALNIPGPDNGKIYKYLGKSVTINDFTVLETLPSKNNSTCKFEQKIENLLQFYPTTKIKPAGKSTKWKSPELSHIDKILNIKTYNNPLLTSNLVIILTEKKNLLDFFNNQKINNVFVKDFISLGQINEDGDVENYRELDEIYSDKENKRKIEPLVLISHNIESIYEYLKKNSNKNKVIISDKAVKLNKASILNQIFNIKDCNAKFFLFSDYGDFNHLEEFNNKLPHKIWKFEKSELKQWLDVEVHENENLEISKLDSSVKIKNYLNNYTNKKKIFFDVGDNVFDKIQRNLDLLNKSKSENKEEIEIIWQKIYSLKMRLQDYIFGFTDLAIKDKNVIIKNITDFRIDKKNFLTDQEYNLIAEIELLFQNIELYKDDLFKDRLDLLDDLFIKTSSLYNEKNTTFIVDNLRIANYYKTNIFKKYQLNISINSTNNPQDIYDHAIVLSELSKRKLNIILNKHHYKNIVFATSPKFKEKINSIIEEDFGRWKNFLLDKESKKNICNLPEVDSQFFFFPEHMKYLSLKSNVIYDFDKTEEKIFVPVKLSQALHDNNIKTLEAWIVNFYGESYAAFTKNTKIMVLNNIFFSTKGKEAQVIKKELKELEVDDYVLIRDSSDRDLIKSEAKMILNNYDELFSLATSWIELIWQELGKNTDDGYIYEKRCKEYISELKKIGYDRSDATYKNILRGQVICPDNFKELTLLFQGLKNYKKKEILDILQIKKIFKTATHIKTSHRIAGRNLSLKIAKALSSAAINVDREPMRVDYNQDGNISLNSYETAYPEAWIVQIKKIATESSDIPIYDINELKWI